MHSHSRTDPKGYMPIVGVVCNLRLAEERTPTPMYATGQRYLSALTDTTKTMPVLIPGLGEYANVDALLDVCDGVLLTGGVSNIEPHHYGQAAAPGEDERDPGRDQLSLRLIPRAVERGIPLFAICRGMQEMNIAYGGTLHQRLHEVPGRLDHRRPRDKPWAEQLAARQKIRLTTDGMLHALAGTDEVMVNSLHGQGLDQVAESLQIEALAEDETVEAVTVKSAASFAVGVQWHNEYEVLNHPFYHALFRAFGEAVFTYAQKRKNTD